MVSSVRINYDKVVDKFFTRPAKLVRYNEVDNLTEAYEVAIRHYGQYFYRILMEAINDNFFLFRVNLELERISLTWFLPLMCITLIWIETLNDVIIHRKDRQ